jgi:hypothetical protein
MLKALRKQIDADLLNQPAKETGSNNNCIPTSNPPADPNLRGQSTVSACAAPTPPQCDGCCSGHKKRQKPEKNEAQQGHSSVACGSNAKPVQLGPKLSAIEQADVDQFYQQVYMDSHLQQGYVMQLLITRNRKYINCVLPTFMYFLFIGMFWFLYMQACHVSQVGWKIAG